MIEKALFIVLVAVALIAGLGSIAHRMNHWATTAQCAMNHDTICIYHD